MSYYIKYHFAISYYIIWYPNFGWESFSHVFFSTICLIMIPMTSTCLGLVAQPASSIPCKSIMTPINDC